MTARQDHIDAMNKYVKLNEEYNAHLDQLNEPGGLVLSAEATLRLITLGDDVEAARQEYIRTLRVWQESGES